MPVFVYEKRRLPPAKSFKPVWRANCYIEGMKNTLGTPSVIIAVGDTWVIAKRDTPATYWDGKTFGSFYHRKAYRSYAKAVKEQENDYTAGILDGACAVLGWILGKSQDMEILY